MIYSIFVRNFTEQGTFNAVINELDRIKALGTDIIWFLPMYPIGEIARKGADGSPYAIKDYRDVDPNYGTMEDFKNLVDEIHQRDMKVMIDIVYNHTSPDSILSQEHPEWFYKKEDGSFGNRVGDWTDIIDLDYENIDLWDYQIETLEMWAEIVDGFRCDVAPLVPIEFWEQAHARVAKINPDFIWLSESVEPNFIKDLRSRGMVAHSDSEIYRVFDMTYDYDVHTEYLAYIKGEISLNQYIYRLSIQDYTYPSNYVKLRNLENHDQARAHDLITSYNDLMQWTAFMFLQRGATLIYNGQEVLADKQPSLFDKDTINWNTGHDISEYFTKLADIQSHLIPLEGEYHLEAFEDLNSVLITYRTVDQQFLALLNLKEEEGKLELDIEDGSYKNLINDKTIIVEKGQIDLSETPLAILWDNVI